MAKSQSISASLDAHQTEILTLIKANTGRYGTYVVFRDFCEMAAISLSNAVDRSHWEQREARYMALVSRYTPEEVQRFPAMLARLTSSLRETFHDVLGEIFMALELGDRRHGQVFTPYHLARMMAEMVLVDLDAVLDRHGFITVYEPAVGGGAMVIGTAHALHDRQVDYHEVLHVTAQDIDRTAVHMSYIQLSLLGIPALVIHGDALDNQAFPEVWVTPQHVLGGWHKKLAARYADTSAVTVAPQALTGRVEQLSFVL